MKNRTPNPWIHPGARLLLLLPLNWGLSEHQELSGKLCFQRLGRHKRDFRVPALRMDVSHDLIQITVLEIYLCFSTTNDIQDIALGSAQNM